VNRTSTAPLVHVVVNKEKLEGFWRKGDVLLEKHAVAFV